MRWLDVAGVPAVGKSAILDREWPRRVVWDGKPIPDEWGPAFECAAQIAASGYASEECMGLIVATFQKIATIARSQDQGTYVQTGLAQIGLELGWRLGDICAVAAYYRVMPVSVGAVFLFADVETVQARNRARSRDFSSRIPAMDRAREIGQRVLMVRGVSVLSLDTRDAVSSNQDKLKAFVTSVS